jgi:hypothetical protein
MREPALVAPASNSEPANAATSEPTDAVTPEPANTTIAEPARTVDIMADMDEDAALTVALAMSTGDAGLDLAALGTGDMGMGGMGDMGMGRGGMGQENLEEQLLAYRCLANLMRLCLVLRIHSSTMALSLCCVASCYRSLLSIWRSKLSVYVHSPLSITELIHRLQMLGNSLKNTPLPSYEKETSWHFSPTSTFSAPTSNAPPSKQPQTAAGTCPRFLLHHQRSRPHPAHGALLLWPTRQIRHTMRHSDHRALCTRSYCVAPPVIQATLVAHMLLLGLPPVSVEFQKCPWL